MTPFLFFNELLYPSTIFGYNIRNEGKIMTTKKIYRAGLIPYYLDQSSNIHMLFMFPSDPKFGGAYYQCCKGQVEDGETNEETALREANEELGFFNGNIDGEVHNLGNFLGRTMMYTAKIKDKDMFGDPHFETRDTKWMTPEEFNADGRDLHKPIVKAAVRYIKEKENLK